MDTEISIKVRKGKTSYWYTWNGEKVIKEVVVWEDKPFEINDDVIYQAIEEIKNAI